VDGLKRQRLDVPLLRKDGKLEPVSWHEALTAAADKLGSANAAKIGALAGPLVELEALVSLKDLLNSLGSTTTHGAASGLSADLRASYTLGATIAGLEEADALLLVGTNPRVEAPLVNTRIRKMVRHFGLQVAAVGPEADLTYEYDHLGTEPKALEQIAKSPFGKVLSEAKRPVVLIGAGTLARPDGAAIGAAARAIAKASGCVSEGWNGYSVLHSNGSAAGALDVGFVPGPTATPINELEVLFLAGADDLPAISPKTYVIYQGHHGDAGAAAADLVLPGAAYTEKSASYVSTEGRVNRTARALDPPGEAREDWSIVVALSKVLGKPLPYETLAAVRERMAEIAPQLANCQGDMEPSSLELAKLALSFEPKSEAKLSATPLLSSVTNFYMTDPVSRASATMAKCSQVFGPRV